MTIIEVVVVKKCPHCGNEHQGLTLRVGAEIMIKKQMYSHYTYCPERIRKIYIDVNFPQSAPVQKKLGL